MVGLILMLGAAMMQQSATLQPVSLDPEVYSGRANRLDVSVPRLEASIQVDGVLDEAPWGTAAILTGFSQYRPVDGLPAEDSTEVLVWYGSSAMYFGVRAFAPPGGVRGTLADRDKIGDDDYVAILLDTFNDNRRALVFAVNPLGQQADGTRSEGGGGGFFRRRGGQSGGIDRTDLSQDFQFESKGRITDGGYEVEVRIPFKSIRFQSVAVQDWGVNIIRKVQYSGYEQTWTPALRASASFLSQSGKLRGLTQLKRGLVLDLNPVLTASMVGEPNAVGPGWDYADPDPELGGNVRWGLTPNLALNATANPDFSQVEADVQQQVFDPRQALFFPEKRPFFVEGNEFFQAPSHLVYTRQIVNPVGALKLNGKLSGTNIGLMSAVDAKSSSSSEVDNPIFNILRLRRDIGASSTAGLTYTDRIDGSDYNRVAAGDMRWVFGKVYWARFTFAESFTRSGGATTEAPLWNLAVDRSGRGFGFNYRISGTHPDFRAASGFVRRTNVVDANITNRFTVYGDPGATLENWTARINLLANWKYDQFLDGNEPNDAKLHFNNEFTFRGGWRLRANFMVESFKYDPDLYEDYYIERTLASGVVDTVPYVGTNRIQNLDLSFNIRTPQFSRFSASLNVITGRDENFFEWAPAYIVFATFTADFRPTDRMRINFRYPLQQYIRLTDGSTVGRRQIPRLKLEYQASRAIFFRVVGQYDSNFRDDLRDDSRTGNPILLFDEDDGTFTPATKETSNDFRIDWLFSYQPNPGTVIFAGYGAGLTEPSSFRFRRLERVNDNFFLKLSYLFRV